MAANTIKFLPAGLNDELKKSKRCARIYIMTAVYCKHWEGSEPDMPQFIDYVNAKLENFLKNEIYDCLQADDERLVGVRPEIHSEVGLERNSQGRLHHHVSIQLIYPRYERTEEKKNRNFMYSLARMNIGAALLQKHFRESYGADFCEACPVKLHISGGRNDDAFAMKEYSGKNG